MSQKYNFMKPQNHKLIIMNKTKNPNMIKQLITANPTFTKTIPTDEPYLEIAEFFCDTIQGENFVGYPSSFLRLQHCTLNCTWCDTQSVWRYGNPYTFNEIFTLMEDEKFKLIGKLREGQHLVLTGGSPLKQQKRLIEFLKEFQRRYDFKPFIEIENECTLLPLPRMVELVDIWNNSPKLSNTGNPDKLRYKPEVLAYLSCLKNSWFKFVVSKEEDWDEIERDFLGKGLIFKDQIVLMPLGGDLEELESNREFVVNMAVKHNVRYTTREHVVLWNKMISC
jgi:7-carboxy-7-deazaguanine synthase